MTIHLFENSPRIGLWPCTLFISLLASIPAQAVDKVSTIEASGEGSIYDLKATGSGTLAVCTQPGRVGDQWRATIGQVNTNGAVSAVGTGSNTAFTGCVSSSVTSNVSYVVLVTWERPLSSINFPASVTTRITGPVAGVNGESLSSIVPRPIRYVEGQSCLEALNCGTLAWCRFEQPGDTDISTFTAPAGSVVSIKIAGPYGTGWALYGPGNPTPIKTCGNGECLAGPLPTTGKYSILESNGYNYTGDYGLSLQGLSNAFRCAVAMKYEDLKTDAFDKPGDTDTFSFVAQAGQVASIKIAGPYGTGWALYCPGSTTPTTPIKTCGNGECLTPVLNSGTCTILTSNGYNYTGSYTLSLQKVSGP